MLVSKTFSEELIKNDTALKKNVKSTPDFVSYTKLPQEGILPLKYMQAGITSDFY